MLALCIQFQLFAQFVINPSNFMSDQNLISPHSNTAESFREIIKIKKMIAKRRSFDCFRNSPCQNLKKWQ